MCEDSKRSRLRINYTETLPKKNKKLYIFVTMVISLEVIFFVNFVKNLNTKKKYISGKYSVYIFMIFITRDNGQSS